MRVTTTLKTTRRAEPYWDWQLSPSTNLNILAICCLSICPEVIFGTQNSQLKRSVLHQQRKMKNLCIFALSTLFWKCSLWKMLILSNQFLFLKYHITKQILEFFINFYKHLLLLPEYTASDLFCMSLYNYCFRECTLVLASPAQCTSICAACPSPQHKLWLSH